MAHQETMLTSQPIYNGKILNVKRDTVRLENGSEAVREVIVHHGGVCVAAIDSDGCLLLVKQFRYPFQEELLELPAGKREAGEDPRECGIRELEEETGCTAERFEKIGELYPTPAYCTEIIHIFYAEGLSYTKQHLDEDEFLTVVRVPFDRAVGLVLSGEIKDAKTQAAILKLYALRSLFQAQEPSKGSASE